MDLQTFKLITRPKVDQVPISDRVIDAVNQNGKEQNFTSLKFKDCKGNIFYDSDWIAGVDYEETSDDDDDAEVEPDDEPDENENDENNEDEDDSEDENEINQEQIADLRRSDRLEEASESNPTEVEDDEDGNEVDEVDDDNDVEDENETDESDDDDDDDDENDDEESEVADDDGVTTTVPDEEREIPNVRRSGRIRSAPTRMNLMLQRRKPNFGNPKKRENRKKKVTFKLDQEARIMRALLQLEACHNIFVQTNNDREIEYDYCLAAVIAMVMNKLNERHRTADVKANFGPQYPFQRGLKVFGEKGKKAALKELKQLHDRVCFTPIAVKDMDPIERKRAQEALLLLTEKRDGTIKGRAVYNGKKTRDWLSKEDTASPTVTLESSFVTGVIDAHENRNVMCADIPNAFIQTPMPWKERGERVMMKITGRLVDMMVEMDPDVYGPYVVFENGRKVIYVLVRRAIYGQLDASLQWYHKFRADLEKEGFVFNPYDPCVANKMVKGKQHTVLFHVDDLKSSHEYKSVNDEFAVWLQKMYGQHKDVEIHRGKKFAYLGMTLDYTVPGKFRVDMVDYVAAMLDEFPMEFKRTDRVTTPATENLFDQHQKGSKKALDKSKSECFHTTVAKGLFVSKRARPDIQLTVSHLCTRVKQPTVSDWDKLVRMMKYLNGTRRKVLTLSADNLRIIKWYVDASFAVHDDYKSHTGAVMTFGNGAVQSISRKQKLNTKASTEAELVGADDASVMILWTKLFMEHQGYQVDQNILYQDNESAILLEKNGRKSAGKRSRALNVRYFFLTDQVEQKNLIIEHCPTDNMWADYNTKPLQGQKFVIFRDKLLGD